MRDVRWGEPGSEVRGLPVDLSLPGPRESLRLAMAALGVGSVAYALVAERDGDWVSVSAIPLYQVGYSASALSSANSYSSHRWA